MRIRSLFCVAVVSMLGLTQLQITSAAGSAVSGGAKADAADAADADRMHLNRVSADHIEADQTDLLLHQTSVQQNADCMQADPASATSDSEEPTKPAEKNSEQLGPLIELTDSIKTAAPTKAPMIVVVDKQRHFTHVLQNHEGQLVEVFHAQNTTGKQSTPTPEGRMFVADKKWDPVWKPPVSIDPRQRKVAAFSKNPKNPLGVAWLGLSEGFIGLHGTNDPSRIGRNASHGCVRHKNQDITKLYNLVPVGTPVYIVAKYSGTRLAVQDVDFLNGRAPALVVAQARGNLIRGWYPTIVD